MKVNLAKLQMLSADTDKFNAKLLLNVLNNKLNIIRKRIKKLSLKEPSVSVLHQKEVGTLFVTIRVPFFAIKVSEKAAEDILSTIEQSAKYLQRKKGISLYDITDDYAGSYGGPEYIHFGVEYKKAGNKVIFYGVEYQLDFDRDYLIYVLDAFKVRYEATLEKRIQKYAKQI